MFYDYVLDRHERIFSALFRWKALSLKNLYTESNYSASYNAFKKTIVRLEKMALLDSLLIPTTTKKIVYLARDVVKQYCGKKSFYVDKAIVYHDAGVANICKNLLGVGLLKEVVLPHQMEMTSHSIEPDALLMGEIRKKRFWVALEFELHQKSKMRLREKFLEYAVSRNSHYVLYFFAKESLFNIYKNKLDEIISEEDRSEFKEILKQRVILTFNGDINNEDFSVGNSITHFNGKDMLLKEMFS